MVMTICRKLDTPAEVELEAIPSELPDLEVAEDSIEIGEDEEVVEIRRFK